MSCCCWCWPGAYIRPRAPGEGRQGRAGWAEGRGAAAFRALSPEQESPTALCIVLQRNACLQFSKSARRSEDAIMQHQFSNSKQLHSHQQADFSCFVLYLCLLCPCLCELCQYSPRDPVRVCPQPYFHTVMKNKKDHHRENSHAYAILIVHALRCHHVSISHMRTV